MLLNLIAQTPDISGVPADFVKSWWQMAGFALIIFMQWRNQQRGEGSQKREVTGELVTRPAAEMATVAEVERLEDKFNEFIEANRAEHQAAITAGQQRVVNLSEVMDKETGELEAALHGLRDAVFEKMDRAFQTLTEKIDPVISRNAAHDAVIPLITQRIEVLEKNHHEAVKHLNSRIDDAMKKRTA